MDQRSLFFCWHDTYCECDTGTGIEGSHAHCFWILRAFHDVKHCGELLRWRHKFDTSNHYWALVEVITTVCIGVEKMSRDSRVLGTPESSETIFGHRLLNMPTEKNFEKKRTSELALSEAALDKVVECGPRDAISGWSRVMRLEVGNHGNQDLGHIAWEKICWSFVEWNARKKKKKKSFVIDRYNNLCFLSCGVTCLQGK